MAVQTTFKRYELKYTLTIDGYERLKHKMQEHMELDEYGHHKISNIYFDTPDHRVIRESIDKPVYKEKLRLRCYGEPSDNTTAFIELKKKYDGIVYKRRITATLAEAMSYLCEGTKLQKQSQISREIDYFKKSHEDLEASVYLSYEREAYKGIEDENLRMTFDFNIKARDEDVSLYDSDCDKLVMDNEHVILEVKTSTGLPTWFLDFLAEEEVYKSFFSKYGTAYEEYILPKFIEELRSV